jgi:hypothetical protein
MLRSNLSKTAVLVGFVTLLVSGVLTWLPAFESRDAEFESAAASTMVPSMVSEAWSPVSEPIIDYSDPVGRARVPLMYVEGRRHELISETVRIWEMASRDAALYARISPELVRAIDAIRAQTDAEIIVVSGYRHLNRNALAEIGGARESQHVAGLAVDVRSDDISALELAELILDVVGCDIGLGLGVMGVHFDLRGYRSIWARSGSEFESEEFAAWVSAHCGDEPEAVPVACPVDETCEEFLDEDSLEADHQNAVPPTTDADPAAQIVW